jgi:hypothetical protein
MATVVHERVVERPSGVVERDSSGGSMTGIIALIIVLILAFLVFYYGLPALKSATTAPQINVPKSVDVNVHTNGK